MRYPATTRATDDTNIVNQAGLSISKRLLTLTPVAAHYDLTYEIVVTNAGPSRAAAASVSDPLTSTLLVAANAAWTCTVIDNPGTTSCGAASGTGALSTTAALDAGGQVKFELTVPTIDGATGVVSNTATVTEGSNTDFDHDQQSARGRGRPEHQQDRFRGCAGQRCSGHLPRVRDHGAQRGRGRCLRCAGE
jgi:hypothetical protein